MSTISMDDKCIIKPCAVPHNYSRVPTVMEKHGKKSYRESRMTNSDNSISIGLLQWFGYGRLLVYVLNSKS